MPAILLDRDELHGGYIDLSKHELRNAVIQPLGADPGSPTEAQFFYRSDTKKIRFWNGTAWQDIATMTDVTAGGLSAAIADAKGDTLVATGPDVIVRKAVGANGTVWFADSAQADGIIWRAVVAADISDFVATARGAVTVADTATIDLTYAGGQISGIVIDGSIANAKLANMTAATFKGRQLAGGTGVPEDMTAAQAKTALAIVPGDVTGFDTQVRTSRLDQMAAPTAAVALNGQKITGLADGTAATDAATFGQLNALSNNQTWKDPVDFASTANINLAAPTTGPFDGVTATAGMRFLAKNQTVPAENGIYVWNGAATPATRATDADSAAELSDATVLVDAGTDAKGDIYTFPAIATLGTTDATPVKTGEGNTIYTANGGITLTGQNFALTAAGTTETHLAASVAGAGITGGAGTPLAVNPGTSLEISGDTVRLAAAAAGAGLTGGAAVALAVGQGTGIIVNADDVAIDTTLVVRKASGDLAGGANTETVTHNLNSRRVDAFLIRNVSPWDRVDVYYEAITVNTVKFYAATGNLLSTDFDWVVMG